MSLLPRQWLDLLAGREGRKAAATRQEPLPVHVVDGRAQALRPPAGASRPSTPIRSTDDPGLVPYQVAIAAQDLLDMILGDEPFELEAAAQSMARLAEFTEDGHHPERVVWTRLRVMTRVIELVELYNPPPELGGDLPPVSEPAGVEELVATP